MVVPFWTTQPWFPSMLRMLIAALVILPTRVLHLPFNMEVHPLQGKLQLIVGLVSGNTTKGKVSWIKLLMSSLRPGETTPTRSIVNILQDGIISVVTNALIPLIQLKERS